jgi:hypothetical protein
MTMRWGLLALGFLLAGSVSAQPPTPESVLGFVPGADLHLATYEESIAYFEVLAGSSDRIQLVETGRTTEGRRWLAAVVSSPDNLARLDEIKSAARRLADPRSLTEAEARSLAAATPAIVDINGGLHATEVAGVQHTIQLAYDLVTGADTDPRIEAILDDVVVVLWPSLNPDGQTMVADWYMANVGTPFETSPLPYLYQAYLGHDNNRDAYMLNMIESRVLARTWQDFEPQIIYVHHQSSPFPTRIWLPPFAEPVAPRVPPLMSRQVNTIGMTIAQMLESRDMPGAVHMGTGFDAWYPGYVDYLPMLRNQVAFWTETALYRYATPRYYTLSDFPADRRELRQESLYSSPWTGGWWRLQDAVDYMRTASIAVLDYASKYREDLLLNRWKSGQAVVDHYRVEPPFAWFVPQDQRDPVAPVELLRRLAFNGIEVSALDREVVHDGQVWPAGTWIIPADQPNGELARQLLDVQHYPDLREYPEGPPEQPYDAAGWTLSYQADVRVVVAQSPLDDAVAEAMIPVRGEAVGWQADVADASPFDMAPGVGFDSHPVAAGIVPLPGRLTGSGPAIHLDPAQNNTFVALNRAWAAGADVRWAVGGEGKGPRWVISDVRSGSVTDWVEELHLQAERGPRTGTRVPRARVALYRPWTASMDEGWTRWVLERYGFEVVSLRDADARSGGLADRYDVVILPSESAGRLEDGHAPGTVPGRYAGGLGTEGVRELEAFVREGGTLVAINGSWALPVEGFHLPIENAVQGLPRADFFVSGSLVEVQTDPEHPLMAGMRETAPVFMDRSPVFRTGDGFKGRVLASYASEGTPLLSGYLLGEEHLQGLAAAVEVSHGDGRVVLLGMRPQWRGQPLGSFRLLFNAATYSATLAGAVPPPGSPDGS